jgi:lipopolysaccharide/colanic/teichoic acid biosynthesis glycosyltransferase
VATGDSLMMRRAARPLLYLGTFAIVLGLAKVHAAYIGDYVLHSADPARLVWTVGFLGLLVLASYAVGLPELPRTGRQALTSAAVAPASAALAISVVQLVAGDALLPRFVVFGSALVLVPWNLVCVSIARGARVRGEQRDRVVLVASHAEAIALEDELDAQPERPAVLVAEMTADEAVPVEVMSKPLCERVLNTRATVVVLDRAALADPRVVAQAASLHETGVRVRTLSLFYEEWLGKLPLSELERASLLFDIRELHGARYLRVKRMFDVVVGLVGVLALILIEPFVLLGNACGNRGPLIYRQLRVGKNGKTFELWKFRTMRDGPTHGTAWTQQDDPRVTAFGRFLRRMHLDELPQMWNVLFGHLSIVGPRPEQPHYVEELSEKLPFYNMRHLVRPGLTGWAQVKYGYAGDEHDALEKLQYEFWYLEHQSLSLDARIAGRTVRSVLRSNGR